MHPVIRIALFLVLSVTLAHASQYNLITATVTLLLLFFLEYPQHRVSGTLRLLYRLRWLFLSVFIVYGWYTPGEMLFQHWQEISPSREGLILGGFRVVALVLVIIAVSLLVLSQSRQALVSAIYWYCAPLSLIGISRQQVALRILLTLEIVKRLQSDLEQRKQQQNKGNTHWNKLYELVVSLFEQAIEKGESEQTETISLSLDCFPPLYQWSYPLLLAIIVISI